MPFIQKVRSIWTMPSWKVTALGASGSQAACRTDGVEAGRERPQRVWGAVFIVFASGAILQL